MTSYLIVNERLTILLVKINVVLKSARGLWYTIEDKERDPYMLGKRLTGNGT